MIQDVLNFAAQKVSEGNKVALVTVTGTRGSSPASPGQMMAVLPDGTSTGTVGGGATEHKVINEAVEAIKNNRTVFSLSIDHAENGMVCGGSMEVFGNIIGSGTGLCIFGGGHIAQSLAKMATQAGFYVTVIEDRPEFEKEFDCVNYIISKPEDYGKTGALQLTDYAVICTRGHSTDDIALHYCISHNIKYIGMIGSKSKVTELFNKLENEGVSKTELDRIYAPVGLDIAGTIPAEIAAAILAELLLIKNNGKLRHKKSQISL